MNTTWRKEFEKARGNDKTPVVAVAPSQDVLDEKFDAGYGGSEGPPVLVWTEDYVYFPVVYDGAEWMDRAPRNPRPEGMGHVGGG